MAKQTEAPAETPAAPAGKKKRTMLIAGLGVLLLGGGSGAAWFFMRGDKSDKPAHAKPKKPSGPPVFLTLDPFVVNLAGDVQHYLQVGIDLRVADNAVSEQIKVHLPEIRNGVLLLLSSKTVEDLSSVELKNLLRAEIREAINKPLGIHTPAATSAEPAAAPPEALSGTASVPAAAAAHPAPAEEESGVLEVLLTSFVIQ